MTTRSVAAALALLLTPYVLAAGMCEHCPKTVFCKPKPPRIKYKGVCPKPICPCTALENYGYYPTRWSPWPFPQASLVAPGRLLVVPASGDQLPVSSSRLPASEAK